MQVVDGRFEARSPRIAICLESDTRGLNQSLRGVELADFESLIRQALARQNIADPAVRQKVYQSSRNALARMIAAAGPQPPAVINEQRVALENSISRIEAGFSLPPVQPAPVPPPAARPAPAAQAQSGRREPEFVPPPPEDDGLADYSGDYPDVGYGRGEGEADAYDNDDFAVSADDAPVYRRRGGMRRVLPMLLLLLVLAGAGWLTYSLVNTLLDGNGSAGSSATTPAGTQSQPAQDADFVYISVLSPQDTSALQLEGRGTAQIVNQSNTEMIRLTSVRPEGKRSEQAEPILIALSPGVLSQVAGKNVTVEIQAKSGTNEQATFSIRCDFDGEEACGRKRFPAGPQPGTIIFTVPFPESPKPGANYNLMINTDVAQTSGPSAQGDPIDIISARLRYDKQ
jgi:hypothetical protein